MKKYAIIGEYLAHSASPNIHMLAFHLHNITADYTKIEISGDSFATRIRKLKTNPHYAGFNVTIPYKCRIVPYLDQLHQTAQNTGAVNTIKSVEGKWIGYNTDVEGFLQPLKPFENNITNCLILGAGGAARAVIYGLLHPDKQRSVTVCMRDESKGQKILQDFVKFREKNEIELRVFAAACDIYPDYDLIVNTTPIGMYPHVEESPLLLKKELNKPLVIYDLIYNPPQTTFLKDAKNLKGSVTTISGVDMLIGQAAESFKIWTGLEFPDSEARQLLMNKLTVS